MIKPNYMLIGAAKCATSSICNLLGSHPQIFMVDCDEPHFFSRDEVFDRGWAWYESLYANAGHKPFIGEGSNSYTMKEVYPNTIDRILEVIPELKLIYAVRDPLERIESLWLQLRSHGGEEVHYDFNTAMEVNRDWLVDSSNYWQQIQPFREKFGDENVHIIFYEDLKANAENVMTGCFQHIGADPTMKLENAGEVIGASAGRPVLRPTLSRLRAMAGYRLAKSMVPSTWRRPLRDRLFMKEMERRPRWRPETRKWVLERIGDDCRRLLEDRGKPEAMWDLTP